MYRRFGFDSQIKKTQNFKKKNLSILEECKEGICVCYLLCLTQNVIEDLMLRVVNQ